jgi:hypothetical protein
MKPRDFLTFFKTKSGKLVTFGVLFAGALVVFHSLRRNAGESAPLVPNADTNRTDRPQVIQTVERPLEVYRPPAPKPEPTPRVVPAHTAPLTAPVPVKPPEPSSQPLPPISLVADTTVGASEPKRLGSVYAPYGRLISCETVITVDSASIQTPIVGLVTEDVYHAGRLVIPAGTEAHGTAQTDRHRERIASGSAWTFVWQSGEELRLKGIALDREFSGGTDGWGITDGSAGLRGRIIKSDDLAEIKLFAATFLSGAASALTEKEQTPFGTIDSRSLNNAPFKGAEKVLSTYAERIYESIQRDGFYVRVAAGKQFYIYVLQTIDRAEAVIGGTAVSSAPEIEDQPTSARIPGLAMPLSNSSEHPSLSRSSTAVAP